MALDRDGVIAKVRRLTEVPPTYEGLKEKAEAFLRAAGTEQEKSAFRSLIEEIKVDVTTIDELIRLTESPEGIALFGEKKAEKLNTMQRMRSSRGKIPASVPHVRPVRKSLQIRRRSPHKYHVRKGAVARMSSCNGFFVEKVNI